MPDLRPYQQHLLRQVQNSLADDPKARLMLQLPTGGGKTVIAGALLANWLQDGRKAVWLTHRKELAEQTRGMLTNAGVSAITNVNWTTGEDAPAMAGRRRHPDGPDRRPPHRPPASLEPVSRRRPAGD